MTSFAEAYADQNESDYMVFSEGRQSGSDPGRHWGGTRNRQPGCRVQIPGPRSKLVQKRLFEVPRDRLKGLEVTVRSQTLRLSSAWRAQLQK